MSGMIVGIAPRPVEGVLTFIGGDIYNDHRSVSGI